MRQHHLNRPEAGVSPSLDRELVRTLGVTAEQARLGETAGPHQIPSAPELRRDVGLVRQVLGAAMPGKGDLRKAGRAPQGLRLPVDTRLGHRHADFPRPRQTAYHVSLTAYT